MHYFSSQHHPIIKKKSHLNIVDRVRTKVAELARAEGVARSHWLRVDVGNTEVATALNGIDSSSSEASREKLPLLSGGGGRGGSKSGIKNDGSGDGGGSGGGGKERVEGGSNALECECCNYQTLAWMGLEFDSYEGRTTNYTGYRGH